MPKIPGLYTNKINYNGISGYLHNPLEPSPTTLDPKQQQNICYPIRW